WYLELTVTIRAPAARSAFTCRAAPLENRTSTRIRLPLRARLPAPVSGSDSARAWATRDRPARRPLASAAKRGVSLPVDLTIPTDLVALTPWADPAGIATAASEASAARASSRERKRRIDTLLLGSETRGARPPPKRQSDD